MLEPVANKREMSRSRVLLVNECILIARGSSVVVVCSGYPLWWLRHGNFQLINRNSTKLPELIQEKFASAEKKKKRERERENKFFATKIHHCLHCWKHACKLRVFEVLLLWHKMRVDFCLPFIIFFSLHCQRISGMASYELPQIVNRGVEITLRDDSDAWWLQDCLK